MITLRRRSKESTLSTCAGNEPRLFSNPFEVKLLVAAGNAMVEEGNNMGLPQLLQPVVNGFYHIRKILRGLIDNNDTYLLGEIPGLGVQVAFLERSKSELTWCHFETMRSRNHGWNLHVPEELLGGLASMP